MGFFATVEIGGRYSRRKQRGESVPLRITACIALLPAGSAFVDQTTNRAHQRNLAGHRWMNAKMASRLIDFILSLRCSSGCPMWIEIEYKQ
jgi:hypothetical protein